MSLIYTLLWVIFVIDSVFLVLIVLLQSGRGGGLSGMLGGGGMAESALGPRTGLPRITGVMAAIFFITAILIGVMTRPRQAMEESGATTKPKTQQPASEGSPQKSAPEAGAAEGATK